MSTDYAAIAGAVAGLEKTTGEARNAIYERARSVLVGQLKHRNPPFTEAQAERERLALEEAIGRVEAEAIRHQQDAPSIPAASAPDKPALHQTSAPSAEMAVSPASRGEQTGKSKRNAQPAQKPAYLGSRSQPLNLALPQRPKAQSEQPDAPEPDARPAEKAAFSEPRGKTLNLAPSQPSKAQSDQANGSEHDAQSGGFAVDHQIGRASCRERV